MRFIVGVDGTDQGFTALEEAIDIAQKAGGHLTVAVYSQGGQPPDEIESTTRELLDKYEYDAELEVIEDEPGSTLIELAEIGEYDQIVLPGGTRSPLGKIKIDGTIEFVLMNARTSVTLIR